MRVIIKFAKIIGKKKKWELLTNIRSGDNMNVYY